jgi:hypothetical protein
MLLEEILSRSNMLAAYDRVVGNKGAAGIDGVEAADFQSQLQREWPVVKSQLENGSYQPGAVKRVTIPKPNGGERHLGIPTYMDRLIQQAISQVLTKQYEPTFSENSYGFRSEKNAHQAALKAKEYINAGYSHVVDLDLSQFFDRVNHDYLMNELSRRITDKRVLKLIHKILRSEIADGATRVPSKQGVPQGGPLALRTHSQTLSFSEGYRLKGAGFDNIIKSIIFMINGKITELGIGQAHKSGVYYAAKGQASAANRRTFDAEVWSVSNPGLSLYPISKGDQRENGDTGKFCSVYCKTATYTDQSDKEIIGIQRAIDQQSGPYSAGRILSQKGSCQKRRNKLRCHLSMIDYGSKSSLRYTVSLFQPTSQLFSLNKLLMN